MQTRTLPSGVTIKGRFVSAYEQFSLISTKLGYKNDISSVVIYVKKLQGQHRGVSCTIKRPQKEQHVFPNKTSGLQGVYNFRRAIVCFQGMHHLWRVTKNIAVHIDGQSDTVPSWNRTLQTVFTCTVVIPCFEAPTK